MYSFSEITIGNQIGYIVIVAISLSPIQTATEFDSSFKKN